MRATVISDASFCHRTKAGGWACWVAPDVGQKVRMSGEFKKRPPNSSTAELWAAYNGLKLAYAIGARIILIQSDCTVVGAAVMHPNGKHGFGKFLKEHTPGATVNYRHVKGHTSKGDARSWVNRWCDEQAKVHMRSMRGKK